MHSNFISISIRHCVRYRYLGLVDSAIPINGIAVYSSIEPAEWIMFELVVQYATNRIYWLIVGIVAY